MASHAHGGADAAGEGMHLTLLPYSVIELSHGGAGLNDGHLVLDVNGDVFEVEEVEDYEGSVA